MTLNFLLSSILDLLGGREEEIFSESNALQRKGEAVPVHTMKVYRESSRVAPLIL
jgi:hypothetical protein